MSREEDALANSANLGEFKAVTLVMSGFNYLRRVCDGWYRRNNDA
jgi:hypothetical protein